MRTAARCALAFIQRWQDVPLFSLSILIFVKFTPVIVVSPAYGVEFIKVGIEGVAKSREVLVPKNISITDQPISEDGCPLMNLPIIRQPGCYLREKFRFGRTARTDYLALEKITLQHRIMTLVRHRITGDTYKVYLSDNSRGSPIIVEPIANMFRIFDTLRRRDGDDSVSICGIYNNKNEWSLCSVEHLFGDECGFQGKVADSLATAIDACMSADCILAAFSAAAIWSLAAVHSLSVDTLSVKVKYPIVPVAIVVISAL